MGAQNQDGLADNFDFDNALVVLVRRPPVEAG
jgi:hypothetical protein